MTTALDRGAAAAEPLAPVTATLRAMFGTATDLPGLAPGLTVHDRAGWLTATDLIEHHLPRLLAAAQHRWQAQPHAAFRSSRTRSPPARSGATARVSGATSRCATLVVRHSHSGSGTPPGSDA